MDAARTPPLDPALTLDGEGFRAWGHRAVDLAADYLAGMRDRPVFQPMAEQERADLLSLALPTAPLPTEEIFDFVRTAIYPHPMGNGHPRFFGWANSPPFPIGALAELLAAAFNPSCAGGDHAAIYLERAVVRWLMELTTFPTEGSMGLLVSGGSMATLTALAAARQRAIEREGGDVRRDGVQGRTAPLILYLSAEGHSCITKATELLGLGSANIRTIPVDADYRLNLAALRTAIAADRAAGARPFCVAASAGTVSTGAIDPLDELADLCADQHLWLHIDGAIGAVGVLDPEIAPQYAGIGRADSLALDPHKWLSVPVECGCVFMRDGDLLRRTFSLVPAYIQTEEGKGFGGLPWYSEYGFQQTRGFRALKLWMILSHLGRSGLSAHIVRHNALARHLAALITAAPDLDLIAPPTPSIVCFRYRPVGWRDDDARLDALNKALMQAIQAGGETFVTNAILDGRFVLRACILHYATTEDDLAALVATVRRLGGALARE
jgi:glutamate/tyrosine decarboxylase-like PLP-dependent enzyme